MLTGLPDELLELAVVDEAGLGELLEEPEPPLAVSPSHAPIAPAIPSPRTTGNVLFSIPSTLRRFEAVTIGRQSRTPGCA